jgi:hypothetical protein
MEQTWLRNRLPRFQIRAYSHRFFKREISPRRHPSSASTLNSERDSLGTHDRAWHNFVGVLQTKAEPGPNHSGFDRHSCAVGLARVYLTRRSARPSRLGHSGGSRRRDPLRWDLGLPRLQVSTETREAADARVTGAYPLSRERSCRRIPSRGGSRNTQHFRIARISRNFLEALLTPNGFGNVSGNMRRLPPVNSLLQMAKTNPGLWLGSDRLFGLFPVMVVRQFV